MKIKWLHFCHLIGLHRSRCTWGEICARQLLPTEWKITPAPVYSQIFCTQPAICYVVKTDFFSQKQRKINCKEGQKFVFILAWWHWVPGWRRTAVGEGWPTHCLLPLPCLAAQSLWQNKPPGILGKHWEPLTGMRTISWEHHSQKSFILPVLSFLLFLNWIVASVIKDTEQSWSENACSVRGLQIGAQQHSVRCWHCKQTCSFCTL